MKLLAELDSQQPGDLIYNTRWPVPVELLPASQPWRGPHQMNKRPRAACKNYWLVPEEPVPDDAGPEPPETSFLPLAELESLDVVAEPAPELTVPPVFEEMPLPDDMPLPIEPLEEPSLIAPGTLFLPLAALVPEALPPLLSVPPVVPVPPAAEVLLSADDVCANASAGASNVKAMAAARNFDLI